MVFLPLILLIAVGVGVYFGVHHYALAHHGGTTVSTRHPLRPTSMVGWASVWVLAAAVVAGLALSTVVIWAAAPLGAVAFVLAVVAMVSAHDRGALLWLPLVVGLAMVLFPIVFAVLS